MTSYEVWSSVTEVAVSQSREARILDAAGGLLLTFGYRKVTVLSLIHISEPTRPY